MTRGERYERTGQGHEAGKTGMWSGQGSGVETKTVANGQDRLWLTITCYCVKKKHARKTTARPYIQSVRSSTSRSFFTLYSQTQHNLSPPCSQKPKTSSHCATRTQNPRPPRAAQPEPRTQDLLTPRNQNPEPKTSLHRTTRTLNVPDSSRLGLVVTAVACRYSIPSLRLEFLREQSSWALLGSIHGRHRPHAPQSSSLLVPMLVHRILSI